MGRTVDTDVLAVAYDEHGQASGWPVVLLHGFPIAGSGHNLPQEAPEAFAAAIRDLAGWTA